MRMMVRTAHMADGSAFEVSTYDLVSCFKRGYIYGVDGNGDQCVLNVAHILYFGPRMEAVWTKEDRWMNGGA